MNKRYFSYKVLYKCGNLEIETTAYARNIKHAWEVTKHDLYNGTITAFKDTVNKRTTTITRKYKTEGR